jgi:branched-chain amino acid transport system ATP-binding protein
LGYFPALGGRQNQRAGTLSGGEQQMLAISRAFMSNPKLMLLDEPSLGLAPFLVKEIFHIVSRMNREGTTILFVEQNARVALEVARYGYILEVGRVVLENTSRELMENEDVKEFYLGIKDEGVRGTRRWKRKKKWR